MQFENPRIQKIDAEIERITDRIGKLQSRLEELRGQRADMYNADLLTIIKDIPPEQLRAFAMQMQTKTASPQYSQPGSPQLSEPEAEEGDLTD